MMEFALELNCKRSATVDLLEIMERPYRTFSRCLVAPDIARVFLFHRFISRTDIKLQTIEFCIRGDGGAGELRGLANTWQECGFLE